MTQGRTVWCAKGPSPKGRICSAFWRTLPVSSEIRLIMEQTYRDHIGIPQDWTPEQTRVFLDTEAARLGRLIAATSAQLQEQAISEVTTRTGQPPDYLTTVALINQAKSQARELILTQELYEQVPEQVEIPDDPSFETDLSDEPPARVNWDDPNRWKTLNRSEPRPETITLTNQVWSDRSALFRIKAGYLLQARLEDQVPLPQHPDDPLVATLTAMVEQDLLDDGLPTDS